MEENEATTVQFNVGGQLYQVARSLLEQYPSTMLYCAAAERWQTDTQATIFIEGDGERFRYCLDYMRRQRVHLPLTIPKPAVLADLDYYGFPDVDPSLVHGHCLISEAKELQATIKEMVLKKAGLLFASQCFTSFVRTGSMEVSFKDFADECKAIVSLSTWNRNDNCPKIFNDYLAVYGLYAVCVDRNYSSVTLGLLAEKPPPK